MNPCNNKSRLTAYLLGELPKPEAEALDAHLAACPECRAAATDLRATLALLQDALAPAAGAEPALVLDSTRRQRLLAVRPERVPTRFSCWFFRRHPALRAAAAAVVVISIVMFGIVNTGRFAGCSQSAPFLSDYKCIASLGSSESSLSDVSGRDQSGLLSGDVCVGRKVAEIPLLTPPPPARVRPEEPQPSPELAAPAGDWAYVNGKAKELQRGYFGYARTARAGGAAQAKHDEDSAKPGAFKPGDTGRGEGEPVKQDIDADGWADAKDAVRKTAPEGKTRLNIALPKPVFSGTPKDINGDYQRMVERELKEESQSKAALGLRTDKAGQVPATETPPASGPAVFDSPAIVKSPVKMKGLYAKRAPAASTPPTQPIGGGGEGGKALDVTVTWEEDSDQLKIDTAGEKRLDNVVSDQRGDKLTKSETKPTDGRDSRLKAGNESAVNTEVGGISGLDKSGADTLTLNGANTFAGGVTVVSGTLREVKKEAADEKEGFEKTAEKPAPAAFNPFVAAAGQPFSTFAMDVDTASYTLTRQAVRSGAMPEPERVRTEEIVNAFDYGDTAPDKTVFRVYQDGAQSPFGAGYNLLRIGVKGRRLGREEQRPAMLTFVIDVSGSMAQPDRIGLARLALTLLAGQLAERDRIQMIAYSDHARLVLEPVAASEKDRVIAAFESLQCNGSTNLEEGMRQAYEQAARCFVPGAENRVILISDGVANLGADSAQEILDKVAANRKQGITCSVFGVGAGTYNDRLLEELANKGDGVYRFLDSEEEVRTAFVDDLAATLNTIAKDAKIQVEWNPAVVRQYRQLGYENRALRKEQFRDDTVDAGEVGSGQSVTALYELELAPDVAPGDRLGTVRIRYQRTDSGKVEEIEAPLAAESVLRPAHAAGAHFRVAASAAEFAELLRGSPYAAGGSFQEVADILRPAALELSLDTRVKELLDLITAMAAMKK